VASALHTPAPQRPISSRAWFLVSILLGLATSVLLDFCFPVAGPMPRGRAFLAWVALIPLLYALLSERSAAHPRYLRRSALIGYLSGLLWYILNCYWIYQTMLHYGNVPPLGSAGIVFLFSAVLGLYFGLFGWLLAYFRRRFGVSRALALAPFLWTAIDLAAARITSVPWDQLGYSQVDNARLTALAPWTGVYGITFVLVLGNVLLLAGWVRRPDAGGHRGLGVRLATVAILISTAFWPAPPAAPATNTAVLLQEDLSVARDNSWAGDIYDPATHRYVDLWDRNIARFEKASRDPCTPFYPGLPQTGLKLAPPARCNPEQSISLVAWPEAPTPFRGWDPRFLSAMAELARSTRATVIAGNISADESVTNGLPGLTEYNSASVFSANGTLQGRYDKIHLVPFGEYVPYRQVFFFARHLTQQVGDFGRGRRRSVFTTPGGRHFGVFICYESVFADEVRLFARNGAEVLVNISDDDWYGDTSAPWQHLNMARMRAIENRRWLLRDTNSGVTAAIDPWGRVTQSAPRHIFTSLAVRYGYRSDLTFYTRYGDIFAYLCSAVVLAALAGVLILRGDSAGDGRV
jgi:apolipoprotein N-acyltransferase